MTSENHVQSRISASVAAFAAASNFGGMGLNGFEPLTSSLSVTRSNQLSYKPVFFLPAVHAFRTPKEFLIFAFHGRNVKRSGKVKSSPS